MQTPEGRPLSFYVKKVNPDTLGWKAGIEAGDRIVQVRRPVGYCKLMQGNVCVCVCVCVCAGREEVGRGGTAIRGSVPYHISPFLFEVGSYRSDVLTRVIICIAGWIVVWHSSILLFSVITLNSKKLMFLVVKNLIYQPVNRSICS